MYPKKRRHYKRQALLSLLQKQLKGFTLIELLVTIAIIAILAALVVTRLTAARVQAHNSTAMADISEAGKGIEVYKADIAGGVISNVPSQSNTPDTLTGSTGTMSSLFTGKASTTAPYTYATPLNTTKSPDYTYTYVAPPLDPSAPDRQVSNEIHYVLQTNLVKGNAAYFTVADGVSGAAATDQGQGTVSGIVHYYCPPYSNCMQLAMSSYTAVISTVDGSRVVASQSLDVSKNGYSITLPAGQYQFTVTTPGTGPQPYDYVTDQQFPETFTINPGQSKVIDFSYASAATRNAPPGPNPYQLSLPVSNSN